MGSTRFVVRATAVLALILGAWLTAVGRQQADDASELKFALATSSQAAATNPTDAIWEMLSRVDGARALEDLRLLTGEEPICTRTACYSVANRLSGSEGLRWAMDYLYGELASLGYDIEFREWSRSGATDRNLVARKVGAVAPGEEVFLVSHVDGVKLDSGERFPAADDNASGVADLLEAARIYSTYTFSRTLVLFFSTGEEQGARGVKSYLSELSDSELSKIQQMIDVDMVGYDAEGDRDMQLWYGDDPRSLPVTEVMSETIHAFQLDLKPHIVGGCL